MKLAALILLAGCAGGIRQVPDEGFMPGRAARAWPVKVAYQADPDLRGSFDEAVDFWNNELDATALVVVASGADVTVVSGDCIWRDVVDDAYVLGSSTLDGHRITLRCVADVYSAYLTMAHELGHAAFGLAHDVDHGYSIMAPRAPDGGPWADFKHVAVTKADAMRVRP